MSLELGRRGFLSMLGGLILGKVLGPVATAEPVAQEWKRVTDPALPPTPRNLYLPMEAVCAKTIQVLNEELKWLRLRQEVGPEWAKLGDGVKFARCTYQKTTTLSLRTVELRERASVNISPEVVSCRSVEEAVQAFVQPAAYALAEGVIKGIRRNGGGEILVTDKLPVVGGFDKCVVATHQGYGLTVRGSDWFDHRTNCPSIRVDICYGIG